MKILMYGTSATIGHGLPEAERLASVLTAMLQEQFADREIDVEAQSWVSLPEARLRLLLEEIERQRPDYLLLTPMTTWVTFPLVAPSFKKYLPGSLMGPIDFLARINRRVKRSLMGSCWPWLGYLYDTPANWVGKLIGAAALYTVPEALAVVERVIMTAKRNEQTEILMLLMIERRLSDRLRSTSADIRRLSPLEKQQLIQEFNAGILALSEKHRLTVVDTSKSALVDLQPDGYHPGPESTRHRAALLRDVIVRIESAYAPAGSYKSQLRIEGARGAKGTRGMLPVVRR